MHLRSPIGLSLRALLLVFLFSGAAFPQTEDEIKDEINSARNDPKGYAEKLKTFKTYFNTAEIELTLTTIDSEGKETKEKKKFAPGTIYKRPGETSYTVTKEGVKAVDIAIKDLTEEKVKVKRGAFKIPAPARGPSGLTKAAIDHVTDQGKTGKTGHTGSDESSPQDRMGKYGSWTSKSGEAIAYGRFVTAADVVIQLIIDDGVADRGHREALFSTEFCDMGAAVGKHPSFGKVAVIDFADQYTNK